MGGIALAGAAQDTAKQAVPAAGGKALDLSRVGDRDPSHPSHPSHPWLPGVTTLPEGWLVGRDSDPRLKVDVHRSGEGIVRFCARR